MSKSPVFPGNYTCRNLPSALAWMFNPRRTRPERTNDRNSNTGWYVPLNRVYKSSDYIGLCGIKRLGDSGQWYLELGK